MNPMASFVRLACFMCVPFLVQSIQQRNLYASASVPAPAGQEPPPPRLGASAPFDPVKAAVSIEHLQRFINASINADGYASIIMMGDSTMAGVVKDLIGVTDDPKSHLWPLHTANDRPEPVIFTNDHSKVAPGGEWFDPAGLDYAMPRVIIERAQTATKVLHDQGCTWTGGLQTTLFTNGPLNNLVIHEWGFIPEYGDSCWNSCMRDAVKVLNASAVLWNIGFHLLNQKFDKGICDRRQNMAKENCGDYKGLVTLATEQLLDVTPMVIFRTTNYLCESKHKNFIGDDLIAEYNHWENMTMRPELEKACHENCPLMGNLTCYDWLMSGRATDNMYWKSINGIQDVRMAIPNRASDVKVLDAYVSSKGCCDSSCNATEDGEHYTGLDRTLVGELAVLLSRSA